ncbi:MAG: leucine/isoleucine/valine-binding protein [Desulfobulbaceae bacterium A2]|nr:MAG: leucine/isoleucine/valine-binding protein [Desulfobulbaceae bacterium A2]
MKPSLRFNRIHLILRGIYCLLVICALHLLPAAVPAAEPPSAPPLVLGQSCALSGPVQNLGLEMRAGLLASIAHINDMGGVKGRHIQLISLDDSYEPDLAVRNTLELITMRNAFLLIGAVGTPTSQAIIPLVDQYDIPFFAPVTGAEFLRTPFRKNIVNVRPSYFQEMEKLASYLVEQKKLTRIACFYQHDSYGFTGLQGIEQALARRGMQLVAKGSYERNTVAIMGALRDIDAGHPEAVVMVGAYSACAEYIKLSKAKSIRPPSVFCNISFVGTESLAAALGSHGGDVIVSQVVPFPRDTTLPLVRDYRASMEKYQRDAPLSFNSLEGYIAGRLFAAIAQQVPGELTRENFLNTMENQGIFDLGGLHLHFGPQDHQGLDTVHLTSISPGIHPLHED